MSDPVDDQKPKSFSPAKLLTLSAVGLLCALGLCGTGATWNTKASSFLIAVGAAVLGLSLIGIILGLLWALLAAIFGKKS